MTKHSGILGALEKAGLVEGGGTDVADAKLATAILRPTGTPAKPYSETFSAVGVAKDIISPLSPDDQARLKALEAQVYAAPSSYVIFRDVRESLGNSSDMGTVFKVLGAANRGVTREKVLADIDQHLGIIAQKRQEFDAQVQKSRDTQAGSKNEIGQLQQQIAAAQARITQLQQSVSAAESGIADGLTRFKAVEDQLTAPLIQAKTLLNNAG